MEAIKVNLIPNGIPEACHTSQYDVGRQIRLNLFDGLTPYTIQAGDTFTLNVRKPDNHVITETVTGTEGNTYLIIDTTEQMTAVTGENLCEIRVINGGDNIGSLNFIMQVEKDVIANGIPSESVIEDLEALVVEAVGDNYYTKTETDELLAQKADVTDLLDLLPTDNASGAIASFTDGADDVPVKALSVEFAATQASGTPTPSAPIPIVGVDKVNVTRTGKNLFDTAISNLINTSVKGWGANDTNIVGFLNTLKEGTYRLTYKIKVDAINGSGTDQYGIIIANSQSGQVSTRMTESNVSVGSIFNRSTTLTVTASNKGLFTNCWFYTGRSPQANADNCTFYDVQLEVGSEATAYEPYNGTTALINLGGTYYGGYIDVVTGKITLTHQLISYTGAAEENWSIINQGDANQRFRFNPAYSGISLVTCSHCQLTNTNTANWGYCRFANNYFVLTDGDNQIGSVENLRTWLATQNTNGTPLSILAELATPLVIYASNTAEIPTILGVNNIFSDTGDVDVTIRADIALYIQKMLGGNANRSLGANPSILRTGAISTDIEVREPVELEREVTEQPENEGNDNEER